MEFVYDGGGPGKGGTATLYCAGKEVGKGRVEQTQGVIFSADETTDIGCETGTTVSPDYTAHTSRFNGKIEWYRSTWARTPRMQTTSSVRKNACAWSWHASRD